MKMTYIRPVTEVLRLSMESCLLLPVSSGRRTDEVLSREYEGWDDDEPVPNQTKRHRSIWDDEEDLLY